MYDKRSGKKYIHIKMSIYKTIEIFPTEVFQSCTTCVYGVLLLYMYLYILGILCTYISPVYNVMRSL